MVQRILFSVKRVLPVTVGALLLSLVVVSQPAAALDPIPPPPPKPGSYGLEATKTQPAPTEGATITTPGSGGSFNRSPITVSGICPNELLVQIYDNGVMVGSVMCQNRSFSLQISLFAGNNDLTASVFDVLGQTGPQSNTVRIRYTNTQFSAFGELITLTSAYGRRSASVGNQLSWPLQLSGGSGPYAFSIDWGDGGGSELKSQALAGALTIAHTYQKAGIYPVNVKVTDSNGVSAFLQVIAVGNGKPEEPAEEELAEQKPAVEVLWFPAAIGLALLPLAYWLGRRSQVVSLQKKMLQERDRYQMK